MKNTKYKIQDIATSGRWDLINLKDANIPKIKPGQLSLLGLAAQAKKLENFPKELISPEALNCYNGVGETPMHFIASSGDINLIPKELITKENISKPNHDGTTPIHYGAHCLNLHLIPKEFITSENLILKNNHGYSTLDYIIFAETEARCMQNLQERQKHIKKVNNHLNLILSKLDTKTLQEQSKENPLEAVSIAMLKKKKKIIKDELVKRMINEQIIANSQTIDI